MEVWPRAVEKTDKQGISSLDGCTEAEPLRKQIGKVSHSETFQKFGANFIQHFGTNYSKFVRNHSGIWEKFRDSEVQKLLRNYSEIIQKLFRNYFRNYKEEKSF